MEIKITLDDAIVDHWQLNERRIKEAIALLLYHNGEVTIGAASNIVGCSKAEFDALMRANGIHFHYGEEELNDDLETLDQFNCSLKL